jgi:Protein of unknown function (DUF2958)
LLTVPNRLRSVVQPKYPEKSLADDLNVMGSDRIVGESVQAVPPDAPGRRYALREVKARLHRASFRDAVLAAYGGRCAISHLPEPGLLGLEKTSLAKGETIMKLLTADIRERLLRNGRVRQQCEQTGEAEPDFLPVVKLFTPDACCTRLLTEIDPEDPDIAFGLCDLGLGYPELGSVSLSELEAVRGKLNLPIERDLYFTATETLSAYADEALAHGAIKA